MPLSKRQKIGAVVVLVAAIALLSYFGGLLAIGHPAPSVSLTARNVGGPSGIQYRIDATVFRSQGPLNWKIWVNLPSGGGTNGAALAGFGYTPTCANPCEYNATYDFNSLGGFSNGGDTSIGTEFIDANGVDSGLYSQPLVVVKLTPLSATMDAPVVNGMNVTTVVHVSGGQPPVQYVAVNYGDGVTVKISSPTASGTWTHIHPYLSAGTYNVSAVVADSGGNSANVPAQTVVVTSVGPPPPTECTVDCGPSGGGPPVGGLVYIVVEIALAAVGAVLLVGWVKPKSLMRIIGAALVVIAALAFLGVIRLGAIIPPVF